MDLITLKTRNLFIRFILILNGIIGLVRFENNLISYTDCSNDPKQTEIEFVLSEKPTYNFSNHLIKPSPRPITDNIDFSSIHKVLLIEYNVRIRHQLKLFQRSFTPNQQFILTLQKKHIWHQSSNNQSHPLS